MTPLLLQKAVSEFISNSILTEYVIEFTNSKGEERKITPTVVDGWPCPVKQNQKNVEQLANKEYAKVLISVGEVKPVGNDTIATLKIITEIESNDELPSGSSAGYVEVLNLLERLKIELLKKGVVDKRYQINDDIQYNIPDEQYFPYWVGEMITNWKLPRVVQENLDF